MSTMQERAMASGAMRSAARESEDRIIEAIEASEARILAALPNASEHPVMAEAEYYGHKTMIDGSHEPLTKDEADSLWKYVEERKAQRAASMPTAEAALSQFIEAKQRLQELGWWQGGGLRVKRGDECAVAEFGSSGIFRGWVDEEGKYVHYADCVSDPRKCWLKPLADLTDDERKHMDECEALDKIAHEAEMNRLTAQSIIEAEGTQP